MKKQSKPIIARVAFFVVQENLDRPIAMLADRAKLNTIDMTTCKYSDNYCRLTPTIEY